MIKRWRCEERGKKFWGKKEIYKWNCRYFREEEGRKRNENDMGKGKYFLKKEIYGGWGKK